MAGMFYNVPFPLNNFLPGPDSRFSDFYQANSDWTRFKFGGTGYGLVGFPSLYLLVDAFSRLPNAYIGAFVMLSVSSSLFIAIAYNNLKSENIFESGRDLLLGCLLTYPFLIVIHTGNWELFVASFLAISIHSYQTGRFHLSAFFLAFAASMKVVPGIFLLIYLADKRYALCAWTFFYAAILTIVPLAVFPGGPFDDLPRYISNLQANQKLYFDFMVLGAPGTHFSHSLFNATRVLFGGQLPDPQVLIKPFSILAVTLGLATAVFVFYEKQLWRRLIAIVVCLDLAPFTSTDYKLLHFLLVAYIFINKPHGQRADGLVAFLLALIVVPKAFIGVGPDPYNTIGIIVSPILMMLLALTNLFGSISEHAASRAASKPDSRVLRSSET